MIFLMFSHLIYIPLNLFENFSKYLNYKGPNSLETSMNYGDIIYKTLRQKISLRTKSYQYCHFKSLKMRRYRGSFININKLNDLFIKNWELKLDDKKIHTFNSPHVENGYYLQKNDKKMFF